MENIDNVGKRLFITDPNGNQLEVTDLESGIEQAQEMVRIGNSAKRLEQNGERIWFSPKIHEYWIHILKELKRLRE